MLFRSNIFFIASMLSLTALSTPEWPDAYASGGISGLFPLQPHSTQPIFHLHGGCRGSLRGQTPRSQLTTSGTVGNAAISRYRTDATAPPIHRANSSHYAPVYPHCRMFGGIQYICRRQKRYLEQRLQDDHLFVSTRCGTI